MSDHDARPADVFSNKDLHADAAAARKSSVRFAFDFPELLSVFEVADAQANAARDRNRRHGILGVAMVTVAMFYASASPLLHHVSADVLAALGYLAAALGLGGTAWALAGLRNSSNRRRWLTARLKTETLRLFQFYYLAARLPEAAAAQDAAAQSAYAAGRTKALNHLLSGKLRDTDEALAKVIVDPTYDLFEGIPAQAASALTDSTTLADLFAAWKTLRLDVQLAYCEAKLTDRSVNGTRSPVQYEQMFSKLSWICIGLIALLHVINFTHGWLHFPTVWTETLVIWTALIALAARALEDGLRPQREVERYEQYRGSIHVAQQRFDAASNIQAKLEIMRAFEQASLEEMRVFLRTYANARYIL